MLIIVSTMVNGEMVDVGDIMFVTGNRGMHRSRFVYDSDWIAGGWSLEPGLRLAAGGNELPGLPLSVEDASPDSWGQTLLQRAERQLAAVEDRGSRSLNASDYLLGAADATRQGALRFRTEHDGPLLADDVRVPKTLELSALLADAEEVAEDPNTFNWEAVRRLLDTGSSALGGARPKAAVVDDEDKLWLAKFPKPDDRNNVPIWEMVALDIAARAGLVVPPRRLVHVAGCQVLLVRRFDRDDNNQRIPYISGRALLNERDLAVSRDYGARGIARRLRVESPDPHRDLGRLWGLAVLNILTNNTDNHLRNHGFLRQDQGWSISPVFDLDPNPDTGSEFATQFDGAVQRGTGLRAMLSDHRTFSMTLQGAREKLSSMWDAVRGWEEDAYSYGARETEVELFRPVFDGVRVEVEACLSAAGT